MDNLKNAIQVSFKNSVIPAFQIKKSESAGKPFFFFFLKKADFLAIVDGLLTHFIKLNY